jgi:quercetin dioxygenase-like cupin family protein
VSAPAGAGASAVPREPFHLKAADQVVRYDLLPDGEVEGTRRGVANGVAGTSTMVNVLEMPPGQTSPPRRFTGDHTVFQLAGVVEWEVEGVAYRLEPGDMLFFPPGLRYAYTNVGDELARFIDVAGRVDDWPPSMLYDDGPALNSGTLDGLFN